MSNHLHLFANDQERVCVALPFDLAEMVAAWSALRRIMIRQMPEDFSRDEWAYLIQFLAPSQLQQAFNQSFGQRLDSPTGQDFSLVRRLCRPRGDIALWLPNNVSLLGPLSLILLTLSGNRVRAKGGNQSDDLTAPFLTFVRDHGPAVLCQHLDDFVSYQRFSRTDPRNAEMAAHAKMRVVFGSNDAVKSIEAMPHPLDSTGFGFSDRRSEAWLSLDALSDENLTSLIKVFAIYGQAGCTSPARVVLLDGSMDDAVDLRNRLAAMWAEVFTVKPMMHIASANIMAHQWAKAQGWDATLTNGHGAVLAAGSDRKSEISAAMFLPVIPLTRSQAMASMPDNIQTLGLAVAEPEPAPWLNLLAETRVKRVVPIDQMHHFGHVWDGWSYWRQAFEEVGFSL